MEYIYIYIYIYIFIYIFICIYKMVLVVPYWSLLDLLEIWLLDMVFLSKLGRLEFLYFDSTFGITNVSRRN